jgi:isopenicillin-N epimerase
VRPNTPEFRSLYLLRPSITFLNHGSFGACPGEVFERWQAWQREMEEQPVEMLALERRFTDLMKTAREALGRYLGTDARNLVYQPNSTTALNQVARSLRLEPGDEILGNDHEYGAMEKTWRFIAARSGARWVAAEIPVPVGDPQEVVERIWSRVTARTRILFVSHVTSATALTMPVAELCRRAREAEILSIVDGAHAPSYVEGLDLEAIGADFYAGNCHKWLSAPKGSAFLYARPEVQHLVEPLVISWGWESGASDRDRFVAESEYQATRDPSPALTVPAAIDFQARHDWPAVRDSCRALLEEARQTVTPITGLDAVAPRGWYSQMCTFALPPCDVREVKRQLYAEHGVEIPVFLWHDRPYFRISIQGYNTREDVDRLAAGLKAVLSRQAG